MHKDTREELKRLQQALLEQDKETPLCQNTDYAGRLHNTDKTDTDLDSLSEAVLSPPRRRFGGLILFLLAAGAAVILWWMIRSGGMGL